MTSGALTEQVAPGAERRLLEPLRARSWRSYPLRLALVIALYYGAAHIGYAFEFAGPVASIVWLPVGVGIAAVFLLGPSVWPAVMIGDLLVNNYSALPAGTAVAQSFGNLLEILIAAQLLRYFDARGQLRGSVGGLARLLLALVAGTIVSATVGLLASYVGGVVPLDSVPRVWRTWWLGDLCGAMVVVPLVIAWIPLPRRPWFYGRRGEALAMLATLVILSTIALQPGRPLSYLAFPALTWAAVRFGTRGATLAILIGAAFTVVGTTDYLGPFAYSSVTRSLLDTQLYLLVSTVATLAVASLATERDRLEENLRASRNRIVAAADDERRRIERDLHDGAQQRLVALSARLSLAASAARDEPEAAASSFESAKSELLVAIEELRELVHGIRPPVLRTFGLARAIEVAAARSTIPVGLAEVTEQRVNEIAEATAYYVVLEGLTNAQRHARATAISVSAKLEGRRLRVEIGDDGVGGAVELTDLGLQGLRDRVEATGGSFSVRSEPGRGTRLTAVIPATSVGLSVA